MRILIYAVSALAAAVVIAAVAPSAWAQTVGDVNRLNAAIQVCSSPIGAGMAECAKLRGGGAPGRGGGGTSGVAGLLGAALGAAGSARAAPPVVPAAPNPEAIQRQVGECVRKAAGNAVTIQACLTAAQRPVAPTTGLGIAQYAAPRAATHRDAAMATHNAAQDYHSCVAASGGAWQPCLNRFSPGR